MDTHDIETQNMCQTEPIKTIVIRKDFVLHLAHGGMSDTNKEPFVLFYRSLDSPVPTARIASPAATPKYTFSKFRAKLYHVKGDANLMVGVVRIRAIGSYVR